MFEQLLVELKYPFTANCAQCSGILFEVSLIDQFLKTKIENKGHDQKGDEDPARYYLLHQGIIPSSIVVEKVPQLNKSKPFEMLFICDIKCAQCENKIGCKIMTTSSEIQNDLLKRILVNIEKVRIRTLKEDVTEQVTERFSETWDNESENDENELSAQKARDVSPEKVIVTSPYNKNLSKKENLHENKEKSPKYNEKEKYQINEKDFMQKIEKDEKSENNQRNEKNYLEKPTKSAKSSAALISEQTENKELVKEIVSSIDFFSEILSSLEKRVSQTEAVCLNLKDKIEKIAPLLKNRRVSE